MSLERMYFSVDFHYKPKLVEKYVALIQSNSGVNDRKAEAFRNLVFKMMKDIVLKNIANYLSLLRKSPEERVPTRDDLIGDCYLIYDTCLQKYKVGMGYNFYFYFNKSLSRAFFRRYQKILKVGCVSDLSDYIVNTHNDLRYTSHDIDTTDVVYYNLGFTELEIKICESRMSGQRTSEFHEENDGVTANEYSRCLRRIKSLITKSIEEGKF